MSFNKILLILLLILPSILEARAQNATRFTADSIAGVYIPKNIEECLSQINIFWDDSTKQKVKLWTEDEFIGNTHRGFGMWMRNNWGLWAGSRLSSHFNMLGVYHPEGMSGIILRSYYRHLKGDDLRLKEQIKFYKQFMKKSEKAEEHRQLIGFKEFSKGDTVEFSYPYGFVSNQQEESYMDDSCLPYGVVLGKRRNGYMLLVKLLNTCDKKGVVTGIYSRLDDAGKFLEKDIVETMLEGEQKWLRYDLWYMKY